LWSKGEKDDAAFFAAVLFAGHVQFAGQGRHLPLRWSGVFHRSAGLFAFRATRRRAGLGRHRRRILRHMLPEHASAQQFAQSDRQLLALAQGNQLILFAGVEHRIESPRRFRQKVFP
jgi:hypothetical protein